MADRMLGHALQNANASAAEHARLIRRPGTDWAESEARGAPWHSVLPEFERAVNTARLYLQKQHPFFGRLLLYCPVVATDHTRTLATRTDGVIFVHPVWFTKTLDSYERAGGLAFAALYLALNCQPRGDAKIRSRWTLATLMAMADLVRRSGLTCPKVLRELLRVADGKNYGGLSDEEIYLRVRDDATVEKLGPTLSGGFGIDGRDGPGVPAEGEGRVASLSAQRAEWAERLRAALDVGQGIGTIPGDLIEVVSQTRPSRIAWEVLLARIVRGEVAKVRRTGMPNRRKLWPFAGLMPGPQVIYPSYRPETPRVDVALDTSGSMIGDHIALAIGVIGDLLRHLRVPVRLIQCDAAVQDVSRVSATSSMAIKGWGGTVPDPVFDLIASETRPPGLLIYVSDMAMWFDGVNARPPRYPVIWVDVSRDSVSAFLGMHGFRPTFGTVLKAKGRG